MDPLQPFAGLVRPELASIAPSWLAQLDPANIVIGMVTLVAGILGILYLAAGFALTPQPAGPAEPAEPYPAVDRLVMPLFLPVGIAAAIAIIIFLVSQILLVVPEAVATPIALLIALGVLLVCSMLATMRKVPRGLVYASIGGPLVVLVLAGGAAGVYRLSRQSAAPSEVQAATATPLEVTTDNKFSQTTVVIPTGVSVTLTVNNKGLAPHNWHLLDVKSADGSDIVTDITSPGQSSKITFAVTNSGDYKFQCDVHPQEMIGTLKVQS